MDAPKLKKKLHKQNPLMMSPMAFALAACGGGGSKEDLKDKDEPPADPVALTTRLNSFDTSYRGDTELDKLIIDGKGIASLPKLSIPSDWELRYFEYLENVSYWDETIAPLEAEIAEYSEIGIPTPVTLQMELDEAIMNRAALEVVEPPVSCAQVPPVSTSGGIGISNGSLFAGYNSGCWGGGLEISMDYKNFEIVEVTDLHEGSIELFLQSGLYSQSGYLLFQGLSSFESVQYHLSYLTQDNALYIHEYVGRDLEVDTSIDQLVLGGLVETNKVNFTTGSHVIVINSEDVLLTNIAMSNLGYDDKVVVAQHLLSLQDSSLMNGVVDDRPAGQTANELQPEYNRFVSMSEISSATQVIVDTEEAILSADLSELLEGVDNSGMLAFTSDTAKLYFDADGDFTQSAVEVIHFTDGILPQIEVTETSYIL